MPTRHKSKHARGAKALPNFFAAPAESRDSGAFDRYDDYREDDPWVVRNRQWERERRARQAELDRPVARSWQVRGWHIRRELEQPSAELRALTRPGYLPFVSLIDPETALRLNIERARNWPRDREKIVDIADGMVRHFETGRILNVRFLLSSVRKVTVPAVGGSTPAFSFEMVAGGRDEDKLWRDDRTVADITKVSRVARLVVPTGREVVGPGRRVFVDDIREREVVGAIEGINWSASLTEPRVVQTAPFDAGRELESGKIVHEWPLDEVAILAGLYRGN